MYKRNKQTKYLYIYIYIYGSAETPVDVENMVERHAHPAIPFGGICRHRILKSIKEIASGEEHPTIYI